MAVTTASIPWHPAFVQAMKLELEHYWDVLKFIAEYRLTAEPLAIDVVIIKKVRDLVIEKNIARIFRGVNILEYKSPDDYFSVYDFHKVLSYAFLYSALNKVPVEDMTVSIIENRHPRALFKYLEREYPGRIVEASPGIYQFTGYSLPVQIIESKKLPAGENLWLKGLTKGLNPAMAGSILEESRKKGKEIELKAYLYAVINTNIKTIQEALTMAKKGLPFDQWVEDTGLAAKLRAEGEARGEARGKAIGEEQGEKTGWEKALEFLKQGYTVEELERMSPPAPTSN